jgi:hypothetical protein
VREARQCALHALTTRLVREFSVIAIEDLNVEATRKGWSERRDAIGRILKFGVLIQRVRIPPGQSADPQAGSEPCSGAGNRSVDA